MELVISNQPAGSSLQPNEVGSHPSLGVDEEAAILLPDQRQELVELDAGIDREGLAVERLEGCLLPFQNRGQ